MNPDIKVTGLSKTFARKGNQPPRALNSIDLELEEGIAFSPIDDQYKQDLFYRYNQNFQDFFDASSRVETTFES